MFMYYAYIPHKQLKNMNSPEQSCNTEAPINLIALSAFLTSSCKNAPHAKSWLIVRKNSIARYP